MNEAGPRFAALGLAVGVNRSGVPIPIGILRL